MSDFPRMVHRPDGRLVVTNQADLEAALAAGWVLSRREFDIRNVVLAEVPVEVTPEPPEPVTPSVDVPTPVKRGRPRKVKE